MIAIMDYGVGNLFSLKSSLAQLGQDTVVTADPDTIRKADRLILPGVGAFGDAMDKLVATGLVPVIRAEAEKKPLLGICLGMQMLGRRSEEGPGEGLGYLPFDLKRFRLQDQPELKVPHMGWDYVTVERPQDPLVAGLEAEPRFYFVHSYHAVCDDPADVLMTCDYGYPFPAAVGRGSVWGTQFHPEKSHRFGMCLIRNFVKEA